MSESILATARNLQARCFTAKLGTMRKPQEFIVYPAMAGLEPHTALIQSDKSIGRFDMRNGAGCLYQGKGEHPSMVCLAHAKELNYPAEVIEAVRKIRGFVHNP